LKETGVSKDLQGKTVVLTPTAATGKPITWACSTNATNKNVVPTTCR
ncbi:prepilin-type cleavage/methylation domain-containing protein, partial [Stutzerimonas stutzeri]